jgi:hypothetical protein
MEVIVNELTLYPDQITAMSVAQLAELPPAKLAEVQINIEQLKAWVKETCAKIDSALVRRYGEQERQSRTEAGKDFGIVHLADGPLRVTVDQPKRVSWDQQQLAAIAARIAASGERIDDYLDVEFSVSESRFNNWPPALKEQFAQARTVKPGKPSYRLALVQENHA